MTFNPYEALDVPRDAKPEQIKRAYKRKAKQTHPDAGGTAEDFNKVNRASLILLDPVRRSRYDRTGDVDETVDNALANSVSIIVGLISEIVGRHVNGGPDPLTVDIIATARNYFKEQIAQCNTARKPIEKAQATMRKVIGRLKHKKGGTSALLIQALTAQADSSGQPLAELERKAQQFRDAMTMLEGYQFEFDNAAPLSRDYAAFTWHPSR